MAINHLKNIRTLSKLLDSQFSIFGLRFGIDPILGLIPGMGDVFALMLGGYIVYSAQKMGLPQKLISQMWRNLFLDLVLGAIPGVGDVADVFFRANTKHTKILERYLSDNRIEEAEVVG